MLAWPDPDRTPDTRRLGEFSPGRENSHGAWSFHRTRLHDRGPPRPHHAALRNPSAGCAVRL